MNQCIINLLNDKVAINKLIIGIPKAFQIAKIEIPGGNPAVGLLREQAIIGYFKHYFKDEVSTPIEGNKRDFDVSICNQKLSIKTATKNGSIKVLWTVDTSVVNREINNYVPKCDLFLIRIWWGSNEYSIFYIPIEVQINVLQELEIPANYLHSSTGTNNRGIEISRQAMKLLENHEKTIKLKVDWKTDELDYSPYDRWEEYWKNLIT